MRYWKLATRESLGWSIGGWFVAPAVGEHDRSFVLRLGRRSWHLTRLRNGPTPDCPICFGTGVQHCGLATHEEGRGCGEPCECVMPPRPGWFRHPYQSMVELITQGDTGWGAR